MKRGQLYRVHRPATDPKHFRTYVVVSRQVLIDSRFSTVICAPVFTDGHALSTQVQIGIDEGMKHPSWIACDNLVSIEKSALTQYVGSLSSLKLSELNRALAIALGLG
jgi:mRNA interferase MazF